MKKLGWWLALALACVIGYQCNESRQAVPSALPASGQPAQTQPSDSPASPSPSLDSSPSGGSPGSSRQKQLQPSRHRRTKPHPAYPESNRYYTNSDGLRVHSPEYAPSVPSGATAQCADGTYSFSTHHQGTCSHHGGVMKWLN